VLGEKFRCLGCGVAKDFVADSVVVGSNSGMGDFSLVKFCSSWKSGSKW
jgi:hypothetical protein